MTGPLEQRLGDGAGLPMAVHQLCSLLTKRRRRAESSPDSERATELTELVRDLLRAPTDATRMHERKEAVMAACRFAADSTLGVLELLLAGEDLTEYSRHSDSSGNTTVMVCAMQCHAPSLKLLLGPEGCPVDFVTGHRNDQRATVLHKLFSDPRKSSRSFTEARAACISLLLDTAVNACALLAAKNKHGNTCLHKAVRQASAMACQPLLSAFARNGVSVSLTNNSGALTSSSSLAACRGGFSPRKERAHTDMTGLSPLHLAAKLGKDGLVQSLLELDAGAAVADAEGNTAMHWAVKGDASPSGSSSSALAVSRLSMNAAPGRAAIVSALASAGGDVVARNVKGETPLHMNQQGTSMAELLLSFGASTAVRDDQGLLPLQHAAASGRLDLVCCLLEHMKAKGEGVTPEELFPTRSSAGEGILHAAGRSEEFGHVLVEHIASIDIPAEELEHRNQDGEQPLQVACRWNNVTVLEALLPCSAEAHILGSDNGQSALAIAVRDASVDCIGPMLERLLVLGDGTISDEVAQLLRSARSAEGLSLVHRAAQVGDLRTLSLLVERLAVDPCESFVSKDGFEDDGSPLHLACRSGQEATCRWLLQACEHLEHWNVNDCENYGRCTALHLACEAGSEECVEMLLAVPDIDITLSSRAGETAIDAALGSPACMQLLRHHKPAL